MKIMATKETLHYPQKLDRTALDKLSTHNHAPCLTIMMPTHGTPPEREGDPLVFKNLVNELKEKMENNGYKNQVEWLSPLETVFRDRDFWNHQERGLAIYISADMVKSFRLPVVLPALTIVSDTFHIKPLYRYFQRNDRFQVLVLNLDGVRLFEGNKFKMTELDLAGKVPMTMKEALGSDLDEAHFNTAFATGKGSNKQANQATGNVVHGYMEKSQEKDNDNERFFRVIDQKVAEHFSVTSGLPLILAALPEHHALFQKVSKNNSLQEHGVEMDASNLSGDELKTKVWDAYYPQYQKNIKQILADQQLAASQGMSHTLLDDIARDAIDGKIDTLLLEENRIIKGRILEDERRVEYASSGVDDVLDDLSALVIQQNGNVVLLPANQMPEGNGAVSINRY